MNMKKLFLIIFAALVAASMTACQISLPIGGNASGTESETAAPVMETSVPMVEDTVADTMDSTVGSEPTSVGQPEEPDPVATEDGGLPQNTTDAFQDVTEPMTCQQAVPQPGSVGSVSSLPSGWSSDFSYISNDYYDIVAVYDYSDSYFNYVVHKVYAKQDGSVSSTVSLRDASGADVGEEKDYIVLTAGEYNYFCYMIDPDDNAVSYSVEFETNSAGSEYVIGDRGGIVVDNYAIEDKKLILTLKQVKENIGSFPVYKIAYYKDGELVKFDVGYLYSATNSLTGVGSTVDYDKWLGNLDFDEFEFVYEP